MDTNVLNLHSKLNTVDTVKQPHTHLRTDILSSRSNIHYQSDYRYFDKQYPDKMSYKVTFDQGPQGLLR